MYINLRLTVVLSVVSRTVRTNQISGKTCWEWQFYQFFGREGGIFCDKYLEI